MGVKKFTLTAADLMVILSTLNDSMGILADWQASREGRKAVHDKIASILHGMEATFTVNSEEEEV